MISRDAKVVPVEAGKAGSRTVFSSSSQKSQLKRAAYLYIVREKDCLRVQGQSPHEGRERADLDTSLVAALRPRSCG
jgi:hypothetical protein